jgi:hypothetical protein
VNGAAATRARAWEGFFKMKLSWRALLLALALSTLAACAHKDLTAPCEAGSGWFGWFEASGNAFACEPLRPINDGGEVGLR